MVNVENFWIWKQHYLILIDNAAYGMIGDKKRAKNMKQS
jgi:hypothetical protein